MTTGTSNRNSGGGGSGGKTNGITNKITVKIARNCNAPRLNTFTMENTAAYAYNAFYPGPRLPQKYFRIPKFSHWTRPPITVFLESKSGGFYLRKTLKQKQKQKQKESTAYHVPFKYLNLLEFVTD